MTYTHVSTHAKKKCIQAHSGQGLVSMECNEEVVGVVVCSEEMNGGN